MKSVFLASSLALGCNSANIVQLAQSVDELSTLVAAVVAADLVDTLAGAGHFTVFAPTNKAFAALPDGVLDGLLKPEGKAALIDVLLYHVLAQEFKYADDKGTVARGDGYSGNPNIAGVYNTVNNKPLLIGQSGVGAAGSPQTVSFRGANIIADNGVVHMIDGVMLPSLVESGRIINLSSRKETVPLQEGSCYHREFNGTSGKKVTGNDQRAFCQVIENPWKRDAVQRIVALQYTSKDGSCTGPRIDDPNHIGVFAQGFNQFTNHAQTKIYGETITFDCPAVMGSTAMLV